MKKIKELGAKLRANKIVFISLLCLLLAGLCAAGWYGWQQYQYRQTSAFALEKLRQALNPPDPGAIAALVDFNSLGDDMARAAKKAFPFYLAGADQEREISRAIQNGLLKSLSGQEKKSMFKEDESEQAQLQKPLLLLPPDFIDQVLANSQIGDRGPNSALLNVKIDHPQLKQPFTLALSMQKTARGWQIRHLANADDLAAQLRQAMLRRHAALHDVFVEKNAASSKKMSQIIPVQSCSADVGRLSDGKTTILIVHALARNKSDIQVNNFNLDTVISGRSGEPILRRFLNAAKPVAPGEDFNHRWSFELDSSSPLAASLLANAPLQCKAVWQTLVLNNGQALHIVEEPNPKRDCDIPGHNHPQGFCLTPIFQR